jgi:hypothetical protein
MILLSPHPDDESLFASIICQRYHPTVVIVTDSFRQWDTYKITAHQRREETLRACDWLGVEVIFMGVADHALELHYHSIVEFIQGKMDDILFVPALQKGHRDHNTVASMGEWMGGEVKVIHYSTYSDKNNWHDPIPGIELVPTPEELAIKKKALACYTSQHPIMPHFQNFSASEWISELP